MKNIVVLFALFLSAISSAQKSPLSIFDNLVGKTWKAKGIWGDGSKFTQEIEFNYLLDSTIVVSNSIGYVDKEQTELGLRNHGIRQYDVKSGKVMFWEFDVFGGRTEGVVYSNEKNVFYQYKYGESVVTDMWEYVNDSCYDFKIGIYDRNKWKQKYLRTQFKKVSK